MHASGQESHSLCGSSDDVIPQVDWDFFLPHQPFLSKAPVMTSGHSFLRCPKALSSGKVTLHSGPGRRGVKGPPCVLHLLLRLGVSPSVTFLELRLPSTL